ncbi:hypothetical protein ACP4OV_021977 [Aristida adscensionis]
MGSPAYRLAAAITVPSTGEFLAVRQPRPPAPPGEDDDYRRYVDSDLYDLPSAPLRPLAGELRSQVTVGGADSLAGRLDLSRLDVSSALDQIFDQFGLPDGMRGEWTLLKYVEEAEFGPDAGVNTVFIVGALESKMEGLQDSCKWMSKEYALGLLCEVKRCSDRIGPYAYTGLLKSDQSSNIAAAPKLPSQEYPPGITLVPMKSKTLHPFRTTNLVVIQATDGSGGSKRSDFVASGDALLIDPGCCSDVHAELAGLVNSLPKKLLVLVTHHHHDHIDGLSVVQRCNADAVLLTHKNTMSRIGEGNWSVGYTSVTGGENICIGDQELQVVFAPDHCVGHGSATLDSRAGGNMKDYFETTYKFLDLSPHVLIPMHGRINLWPKHMLCGYLRNRRSRETSILQSIENGAQTLFEIVSKTYNDVDRKLWVPASFNVRLHVDHLNTQQKLPKPDFSIEKFKASCGARFMFRWAVAFVQAKSSGAILVAGALAGSLAIAYALKRNNGKLNI